MDKAAALAALQEAQRRKRDIEQALKGVEKDFGVKVLVSKVVDQPAKRQQHLQNEAVYHALESISLPLANSYSQVIADLNDHQRMSWAGTAHELRQIVSTLLQQLAPDTKVMAMQGYKQEPNTSGPTQKQRAIYIMRQRATDSRVEDLVKLIADLEEVHIADVVRGFYNRASDAAHRHKNKSEVERLLNYFHAFVIDLLDL